MDVKSCSYAISLKNYKRYRGKSVVFCLFVFSPICVLLGRDMESCRCVFCEPQDSSPICILPL